MCYIRYMSIRIILLVGAGSFAGGILRYILSQSMSAIWQHAYPFGTFTVNLIGCLVIGCVIGMAEKQTIGNEWKLFLATGLCGGFTTFSAFSLETLTLIRNGQLSIAFPYITLSVVIGIAATWSGYALWR